MAAPILTPEEVREFINDKIENNHLLDDVEFTNTRINLAMEVAVDRFNMLPPIGKTDVFSFPSKTVLMYGTLWALFDGQAAMLARNHMSYSDGGIQIPVEERMALYRELAVSYLQVFESSGKAIKVEQNFEDGWGGVSSDYSRMPLW